MNPSTSPDKLRFVFWQNGLAFYQAPHIRALAGRGHEVVWLAEEDIAPERREQGWSVVDAAPARTIVTTDPAIARELLAKDPENSVHVFTGIRGTGQHITDAFMTSLRFPTRRVVLIEQRDGRGLKGLARWLRFRADCARYGAKIEGILCMGYTGARGGRHWYRRCGFPDAKIWPYGYFPEADPTRPSSSPAFHDSPPVRLMFLGTFIPRKGVDILLRALGDLKRRRPDLSWNVLLMGNGPEQTALETLAQTEGIAEAVTFSGSRPNDEAMGMVAQSDVFVLPSRFDGWGVVVNEALLRGVPVVCSDWCGAKDLLRAPWRGSIFPEGDALALSRALETWIERAPKTPESAARIRDWTKCIAGAAAADYFLARLNAPHPRRTPPPPPWLQS